MNTTYSTMTNNTHDIYYPISYRVLGTTFGIILLILIVVANSLIISAFRHNASLRTVTNALVISLAVSDMLIALGALPLWIVHLVHGYMKWHLGPESLRFFIFIDLTCGAASIINLSVISLERYFCICTPFIYFEKISLTKTTIVICLVWAFSITLGILRIVLFWLDFFTVVVVIICFPIPLVIMTVCYCKIFSTAKKQIKKIEMVFGGKERKFRLWKEVRAAKILCLIMGVFLFCWGPFLIANSVAYSVYFAGGRINIPPSFWLFCKWFHYMNSFINPILYGYLNKDFRKAIKSLVKRFVFCHGRDQGTTSIKMTSRGSTQRSNSPLKRQSSENGES